MFIVIITQQLPSPSLLLGSEHIVDQGAIEIAPTPPIRVNWCRGAKLVLFHLQSQVVVGRFYAESQHEGPNLVIAQDFVGIVHAKRGEDEEGHTRAQYGLFNIVQTLVHPCPARCIVAWII